MSGIVYSRITGTGSYLPGASVGNAELIKTHGLESSDEWIVERTGIKARHIAPATMSSSDLALEACRRALEAAGKQPTLVPRLTCRLSAPVLLTHWVSLTNLSVPVRLAVR